MLEGVTENAFLETPDVTTPAGTSPIGGGTEKTSGFESGMVIMILFAVYSARAKEGKCGENYNGINK